MCSLINKQLLLTAYAYLFIMEQQEAQQGSEALQLQAGGDGASAARKKGFSLFIEQGENRKLLASHLADLSGEKVKKGDESAQRLTARYDGNNKSSEHFDDLYDVAVIDYFIELQQQSSEGGKEQIVSARIDKILGMYGDDWLHKAEYCELAGAATLLFGERYPSWQAVQSAIADAEGIRLRKEFDEAWLNGNKTWKSLEKLTKRWQGKPQLIATLAAEKKKAAAEKKKAQQEESGGILFQLGKAIEKSSPEEREKVWAAFENCASENQQKFVAAEKAKAALRARFDIAKHNGQYGTNFCGGEGGMVELKNKAADSSSFSSLREFHEPGELLEEWEFEFYLAQLESAWGKEEPAEKAKNENEKLLASLKSSWELAKQTDKRKHPKQVLDLLRNIIPRPQGNGGCNSTEQQRKRRGEANLAIKSVRFKQLAWAASQGGREDLEKFCEGRSKSLQFPWAESIDKLTERLKKASSSVQFKGDISWLLDFIARRKKFEEASGSGKDQKEWQAELDSKLN